MTQYKYYASFIFTFIFNTLAFASSIEIHEHKSKEIGINTPIPKIELTLFRDSMDGVNVHIDIANYVLNAPDLAPTTLTSEKGYLHGHAHVFINGIKKQRLYGNDIHIPQRWLKKGVNQIAISLNSHQHENWTSEQQYIVGSIFLDLSKKDFVLHNFTSQPINNPHVHH